MTTQPIQLDDLAERIGATLIGNGVLSIDGVNTIADATDSQVCFLSNLKFTNQLVTSQAAAVITAQRLEDIPMPQLLVGHVDKALVIAMTLFAPSLTPQQGIHPTAVIDDRAELDASVSVGPGSYIGPGVKIGAGTTIGPNCSIGENTVIGAGTTLHSNVVVYHNCRIGNGCMIQAQAAIGTIGFGYSFFDGQHNLIPHNGGVVIEDGVDIGPGCCIDRAKFGNTTIGAGTKFDNLVHIAHNVEIGKACLLAGQIGIAGSCKIGHGVAMGGQVGLNDQLTIGDGVMVGSGAGVTKHIEPGRKIAGFPAVDLNQKLRQDAAIKRLPELLKTIKKLETRVAELEANND